MQTLSEMLDIRREVEVATPRGKVRLKVRRLSLAEIYQSVVEGLFKVSADGTENAKLTPEMEIEAEAALKGSKIPITAIAHIIYRATKDDNPGLVSSIKDCESMVSFDTIGTAMDIVGIAMGADAEPVERTPNGRKKKWILPRWIGRVSFGRSGSVTA